MRQKSLRLLTAVSVGLTLVASPLRIARSQPLGTTSPHLWRFHTTEASSGGLAADLELDAAGSPRLAFGQSRLYYAILDSGIWNVQVVDDTPGAGQKVSLAFDSGGNPQIAYLRREIAQGPAAASLRYAAWNGSQWDVQTITGSFSPDGIALTMDSSDHPNVVFKDPGGVLSLAKRTGTQWGIQTIDAATAQPACPFSYPSAASETDGTLHVSYSCEGLRYAKLTGSEWDLTAVDTSVPSGRTSLQLDSSGNPQIAYEGAADSVRFVSWSGDGWGAPATIALGADASLAMGSADIPRVSYVSAGDSQLHEATLLEGAWVTQQAAGAAAHVGTSQAVSTDGQAHIAYFSSAPGSLFELRYTHEDAPGSWSSPDLVQKKTEFGWGSSIAIDGNNHPHITYQDRWQGALRYATWDGADWTSTLVDDVGDFLVNSSIKIDSNNTPHIAYFAYGLLKYASLDGNTWNTESVSGSGGQYASLALDSSTDSPRIAYCGDGLQLASWNSLSSTWEGQKVDDVCGGGDFGGETSLALDNDGNPHIAYHGGSNGPLRYIAFDGASWTPPSEIAGSGVGTSIALDSLGVPHIAFCGGDSISVPQHATPNGSNWDIVPMGAFDPPEAHTCGMIWLAMDQFDTPHAAYQENHLNDIRYLTRTGGSWAGETVDANIGFNGLYYSPIAVGPDGLAWIAYSNGWSGDMMAAQQLPALVISGTVRIAGAKLHYNADGPRVATADADGSYTLWVPTGWTGTITPDGPGCTFAPDHLDYSGLSTDLAGQDYAVQCTMVYTSVAADDGWLYESGETSGKGGGINSTDGNLYVGDLADNIQLRSLVSFSTGAIPDDAVLTSVKLKLRKKSVRGVNPFNTHGKLVADIRTGAFGANPALQKTDFQAPATEKVVLAFTGRAVDKWYIKALSSANFRTINLLGLTQFRLRFQLDDDNDNVADFVSFYSGNAQLTEHRPMLTVGFHVP